MDVSKRKQGLAGGIFSLLSYEDMDLGGGQKLRGFNQRFRICGTVIGKVTVVCVCVCVQFPICTVVVAYPALLVLEVRMGESPFHR